MKHNIALEDIADIHVESGINGANKVRLGFFNHFN